MKVELFNIFGQIKFVHKMVDNLRFFIYPDVKNI